MTAFMLVPRLVPFVGCWRVLPLLGWFGYRSVRFFIVFAVVICCCALMVGRLVSTLVFSRCIRVIVRVVVLVCVVCFHRVSFCDRCLFVFLLVF